MARIVGYAWLKHGDYVDVRLSADELERLRQMIGVCQSYGLYRRPEDHELVNKLADIQREFYRELEANSD